MHGPVRVRVTLWLWLISGVAHVDVAVRAKQAFCQEIFARVRV